MTEAMRTIEYRTVDKSTWGDGDWQSEPDKKQWQDEATGYPCLIVRNRVGALCGYVGIHPEHPLAAGRVADETMDAIDVHGGITYGPSPCQEGGEADGVCHVATGEDRVLWLGFDCCHCGDLSPKLSLFDGDVYRNFAYVTTEVESLAKQLKAMDREAKAKAQ